MPHATCINLSVFTWVSDELAAMRDADIEQINDLPIKEGDEVLGVLDPTLQKVYSLWKVTKRRLETIKTQAQESKGELTLEQREESYRLDAEKNFLWQLLWMGVRQQFNAYYINGDGIAVRNGYQAVVFTLERHPLEDLAKFLDGMSTVVVNIRG